MQATNRFYAGNKIKTPRGNSGRQRQPLAGVFKVKVNSFQPLPARRAVTSGRYRNKWSYSGKKHQLLVHYLVTHTWFGCK